jgi:hypothetical protein
MSAMTWDPVTSVDDREAVLARLATLEARVGSIRRTPDDLTDLEPVRAEQIAARLAALEARAGIFGDRHR